MNKDKDIWVINFTIQNVKYVKDNNKPLKLRLGLKL